MASSSRNHREYGDLIGLGERGIKTGEKLCPAPVDQDKKPFSDVGAIRREKPIQETLRVPGPW